MKSEVFLDSSFVSASISERDQYHSRAVVLDLKLRLGSTRIITTTGVLLEIGNSPQPGADEGFGSARQPRIRVARNDVLAIHGSPNPGKFAASDYPVISASIDALIDPFDLSLRLSGP